MSLLGMLNLLRLFIKYLNYEFLKINVRIVYLSSALPFYYSFRILLLSVS